MEYNSWLREPLDDYVEHFDKDHCEDKSTNGFNRALQKWSFIDGHLCRPDLDNDLRSGLSISQLHAYQLLHEWWTGQIQQPALSQFAQQVIQNAASQQNAENGYQDVDRELAHLSKSTYHRNMFMLFQLEFVHEFRQLHEKDLQAFFSFVQEQRQLCASNAAIQRVAWSFAKISASDTSQHDEQSNAGKEQKLGDIMLSQLDVIPACIEACPWLQIRKNRNGYPFFLWDVALRKTVEIASLRSQPEYICTSHTWGRWRIEGKEGSLITVDGVLWLVPQNTRFRVQGLPELLLQVVHSGYVWFDLFCIPQDRSERALIEIARQASIFGNADFAVA